MKINVTQKDIEKGRKECEGTVFHATHCPVFQALKRRDIDCRSVEGYYTVIGGQRITLPDKVQVFISRFDDDKPVKPFSFELPIL